MTYGPATPELPAPTPESMFEILRDANRTAIGSLAFMAVGEVVDLNLAEEQGDAELGWINRELEEDIPRLINRGRRQADRLQVATELDDDNTVKTSYRGVYFVENILTQPVRIAVEVSKTRPDAQGHQMITGMTAIRLAEQTRIARVVL